MTEEEAKTKLCVHQPFERTSVLRSTSDPTFQQTALMTVEPKCIGSACMAWRVAYLWTIEPHRSLRPVEDRTQIVGGYCGLAGKP